MIQANQQAYYQAQQIPVAPVQTPAQAAAAQAKAQATAAAKTAYKAIKDDGPGVFMTTVIGLAIAVALALIWKLLAINVAPYTIVMGDTMPPASRIPIIGWGWDFLNLCLYCTGSVIAFIITNAFQSAWIFLKYNRKAHRRALRQARQELAAQSVDVGTHNAETRKAARKLARIPFGFIRLITYGAVAGFVIEAIFNIVAYPPVPGGFTNEFWTQLKIADYSMIDFKMLSVMLYSLCSTEALVLAAIAGWSFVLSQWD